MNVFLGVCVESSPSRRSGRRRMRPRELGYCWGDTNYYDNENVDGQVINYTLIIHVAAQWAILIKIVQK